MTPRARVLATAATLLAFVGIVALAGAVVSSCGSLPPPTFLVADPPGGDAWHEVADLPAWVTAPPAEADALVFLITNRSNFRSIAGHEGGPRADRDAAKRVRAALEGVVPPAELDAVLAALPAALHLRARAARDELLTRRTVVGNTLSTVWALWVAPLDEVVAPLPDERRSRARAALATSR